MKAFAGTGWCAGALAVLMTAGCTAQGAVNDAEISAVVAHLAELNKQP